MKLGLTWAFILLIFIINAQRPSEEKFVSNVIDDTRSLIYNIDIDQQQDKISVESQRKSMKKELMTLDKQKIDLVNEKSFILQKLEVLDSQSNIIDNLFSQDDLEFAQRIGNQQSMLDTVDSLVDQIVNNLENASAMIKQTDFFEEMKKLGKGKHLEALAQITTHLDQELVEQILDLFDQLRQSLLEGITEDEKKVQDNILLHNSLRSELGLIIANTNSRLEAVSKLFEEQGDQEKDYKNKLTNINDDHDKRKELRNDAIENTQEAIHLLEDNESRIDNWQQVMNQDSRQE